MQDFFALFGLPRQYEVDLADLERRYHDLQRKLHPDRFARASAGERVRAMQQATTLNDAYRVLKDPVRRAEYMLGGLSDKEPIEQGFLMEILELREALSEARAAGDRARVDALDVDMRARREQAMARIAGLFERMAGEADDDIRRELVLLRYFQRFLDEIDEIDEGDETDERDERQGASPGKEHN